MAKILIIVNPTSGDEMGTELAQSLEKLYKKKEIQTKIYETKGNDNFNELVKESMAEGYEEIVLFGGDGTVSALVNGIVELEQRPKILLIPSGTTNNFGRTIGSDKTGKEFLAAIEKNELTEIAVDVGCVNDQYFISSIAVGLLPTVGWETDEDLKAKIGTFAYIVEGIKAMADEEQETFDLQIYKEDEELNYHQLVLFIVGLSNSIMGIDTFFEQAAVDDGKLHYFGLEKAGIMKEANVLLKQVLKKTEDNVDGLGFTGEIQRASLQSASSFNFLVDGEKGPTFPIKLDILHKHLIFVVPKRN